MIRSTSSRRVKLLQRALARIIRVATQRGGASLRGGSLNVVQAFSAVLGVVTILVLACGRAPNSTEDNFEEPKWLKHIFSHPEQVKEVLSANSGWEHFAEGHYYQALAAFREHSEVIGEARSLFRLSLVHRNLATIQIRILAQYFSEMSQLHVRPRAKLEALRRRLRRWETYTSRGLGAKPMLGIQPVEWSPCLRAKDLVSRVGCGSLNNLSDNINQLQQELVASKTDDGEVTKNPIHHSFDPAISLALADGYLRMALRKIAAEIPRVKYNHVCATRPRICQPIFSSPPSGPKLEDLPWWLLGVDPLSSTPLGLGGANVKNTPIQVLTWGRKAEKRVQMRANQHAIVQDLDEEWHIARLAKVSVERRWAEVFAENGRCEEALYIYQRRRQKEDGNSINATFTAIAWSRIAMLGLCVRHYPTMLKALEVLGGEYPTAKHIIDLYKDLKLIRLLDITEAPSVHGT